MKSIIETYSELCNTPSDIHEHLPTLATLTADCNHVTEMGVRWICSTYAFLQGKPEKLISYDIENPSHWGADINNVYTLAATEGIDYSFIQASTLEVEIEQTDLLFIDTWHIYDQLKSELNLHHHKVNKYIVMHDTTSYCYYGESEGHQGLWPAIDEFLDEHPEWVLSARYTNNNGLTILIKK